MPNNKSLISAAALALGLLSMASFSTVIQAKQAQFSPLSQFGDNPGELTASYFKPSDSAKTLVVLLHGCVQDAKVLAKQSGFLAQAQAHNFVLLLPQQSKTNNIKQCFNWFSAPDTDRDKGETLSLKNMIASTKKTLGADKVYIAGLSAGGAMASSMLVNYPEQFNGGAVIAGLPYPCADSLIKAISCMRTGPSQSADELATLARKTSPNTSQWPPLYVITGGSDNVVNADNSAKLAQQWAQLSSLSSLSMSKQKNADVMQWVGHNKKAHIKLVTIADMDHGLSVNPDVEGGGVVAPFLPKAQLSAAKDIVDFWQLN